MSFTTCNDVRPMKLTPDGKPPEKIFYFIDHKPRIAYEPHYSRRNGDWEIDGARVVYFDSVGKQHSQLTYKITNGRIAEMGTARSLLHQVGDVLSLSPRIAFAEEGPCAAAMSVAATLAVAAVAADTRAAA